MSSPSPTPVITAKTEIPLLVGKRTDFSIETLLKKSETPPSNCASDDDENFNLEQHRHLEKYGKNGRFDLDADKDSAAATFSWLTCTRYKPPKLPRSKKKAGCMSHGRGPRIPFAAHQIAVLETTFSKSQYLSSDCIHRLADTLHLSETRVKIWFQNRRARYRRERESPATNGNGPLALQVSGNFKSEMQLSPGEKQDSIFQPMEAGGPQTQQTTAATAHEELSARKYLSKRKLNIPDFISMQIQHHRHAQQLQYYLQQGYSPTNSPLLHTALQSNAAAAAAAAGFQFPGGFVPEFNSAEASAQLRNYICAAGGNTSCGPVSSGPIQITFP